MEEVRAALAQRRSDLVLANRSDNAEEPPVLWSGVRALSEQKPAYCLAELLAFSDREFVDNAYRVVLRRAPDPEGLSHYLGRLRAGSLSKVEVLGELRWSTEGMSRGIHVDGLLLPYRLQRLKRRRYIGPVAAWLHGIARLGSVAERLGLLEARLSHALEELGRHVNRSSLQLSARTSEAMASIDSAKSGIERLAAQIDCIDAALVRTRTDVDQVAELHRAASVAHDQSNVRLQTLAERLDLLMQSAEDGKDAVDDLRQQVEGLEGQMAPSFELRAFGERLEALAQSAQAGVDTVDSLRQHVARLEAQMAPGDQLQELRERVDELTGSARLGAHAVGGLKEQVAGLEESLASGAELQELRERVDVLTGSAKLGLDAVDGLKDRLAGLEEDMASGAELQSLGEQLDVLTGTAKLGMDTLEDLRQHVAALDQRRDALAQFESSLDPLYVAFERRFRGAPELIESRIEPYLEVLREANVGRLEQPVVDLGSGNGEWLDVLRRNGFSGRGVDSNRMFVDLCRGRGLDVVHGDALEYLRSLPDGSVGAITAMHVAEHLPFHVLIQLLDEAHRALCVGGVIALETPNPENVLVGSHYFYMDPTHRNPIPPEALRWLVEARGFQRTRIERLTVDREISMPQPLPENDTEAVVVNAMLAHFRAALDYSVIGRRL